MRITTICNIFPIPFVELSLVSSHKIRKVGDEEEKRGLVGKRDLMLQIIEKKSLVKCLSPMPTFVKTTRYNKTLKKILAGLAIVQKSRLTIFSLLRETKKLSLDVKTRSVHVKIRCILV